MVRADESLLRHILANLISNAAKYSDAGKPVKLSVALEESDAVFRVEDHGIGIPEANRAQLFEAFQRGSNVGNVSGTGLGLVVVKRGVALRGVSVDFTCTEGRGTTFYRATSSVCGPPKCILIIEDEAQSRGTSRPVCAWKAMPRCSPPTDAKVSRRHAANARRSFSATS